jgi:DNA-binding transcriptional ArsR family regulator
MQILHESPSNANQLAKLLDMDYTTIRHHLKVLEENKIILPIGKEYAKSYVLASYVEDNYKFIEGISEAASLKAKRLKTRFFDGSLSMIYQIGLLNGIFQAVSFVSTIAARFSVILKQYRCHSLNKPLNSSL